MLDITKIVEVLLFATPVPLTEKRFQHILNSEKAESLSTYISKLNIEYKKQGKGLLIQKISNGYQLLSLPEYNIYINRLFNNSKKNFLSKASMEALSIIAYRQPVSKVKIESIRGVECGSVLNTLINRDLIAIKGRGKTVGRPLLFVTTNQFLSVFGLASLSDLPRLKEISELINKSDPRLF